MLTNDRMNAEYQHKASDLARALYADNLRKSFMNVFWSAIIRAANAMLRAAGAK